MVKALILGQMATNTSANGKITKRMDKELLLGQMEEILKTNCIKTKRKMVKALILLELAESTSANSKMTK